MITLISTIERVFRENWSSSLHGLPEIGSLRHPGQPKPMMLGFSTPSSVHARFSTFKRSDVQTFKRLYVPTLPPQPSTAPICSSFTAFVPQTTNLENPPITHNSPRGLALKSQDSYLFLEKRFLKFFYSKIPSGPQSPVPGRQRSTSCTHLTIARPCA